MKLVAIHRACLCWKIQIPRTVLLHLENVCFDFIWFQSIVRISASDKIPLKRSAENMRYTGGG